jgi:hypothetical protein
MVGSFGRTIGNEKCRPIKHFVQKTVTTSGKWLKLGDKSKIILDVLRLKTALLKRTKTQRLREKFLNDKWLEINREEVYKKIIGNKKFHKIKNIW